MEHGHGQEACLANEAISLSHAKPWSMAMEASLVGNSKSFRAHEAMEYGHGHRGRPSRRLEILHRTRSYGVWPWMPA